MKIYTKKHIILFCVILGFIIRLVYCIVYPVQPRDAFQYYHLINQLEKEGTIGDQIVFFSFSLYLFEITHVILRIDIIKSGIVLNMILGLFLIATCIMSLSIFFKKKIVLLLGGLCVATHPTLIKFSCTCLRENTSLFFLFVSIVSSIRYIQKDRILYLFLSALFTAMAILCKLESIELIPITLLSFLFFQQKKERFLKTVVISSILYILICVSTSFLICKALGLNIPAFDKLMLKF